MKDKTITLKPEKTIKLSELTEEQRMIYDSGFDDGQYYGRMVVAVLCLTAAVTFFLLMTFAK